MPVSSVALRGLALARMVVGSSLLIAPTQASPLFGITLSAEGAIAGRLFGARDLLIALWLWKATTNYKTGQTQVIAEQSPLTGKSSDNAAAVRKAVERHDLSSALLFGAIVDSIDVLSCVACILEGNFTDLAKIMTMGGAALFASLGAWQHRSLP